ncbi:MAG: hypothetical protein ACREX9_23240 [Gammaproteobacteria bacterium]
MRATYEIVAEAEGADDLRARGDERSDAHARILRHPRPGVKQRIFNVRGLFWR